MNNKVALFLKANLAALWLAIVLAVLMPDLIPFSGSLVIAGLFLVVAHTVEIAVFRSKLKTPSDYAQTFFFGMIHIKPLKATA